MNHHSSSSSHLPDIVCPPTSSTTATAARRLHLLCISVFVKLTAELIREWLESTCLPAQAVSFTPSCARSNPSLQTDSPKSRWGNNEQRCEREDFQPFKKLSHCNFRLRKRRCLRIKYSLWLEKGWNQSQIRTESSREWVFDCTQEGLS